MDVRHNIYELQEDEQTLIKEGLKPEATEAERARFEKLREDVARLDGYLKGRADSDARRLGEGRGLATGLGANGDLTG